MYEVKFYNYETESEDMLLVYAESKEEAIMLVENFTASMGHGIKILEIKVPQ